MGDEVAYEVAYFRRKWAIPRRGPSPFGGAGGASAPPTFPTPEGGAGVAPPEKQIKKHKCINFSIYVLLL